MNEQNELIVLTLETESDNGIKKQDFVVYCTMIVGDCDYIALVKKESMASEGEIEVQFMRYTITDDVMDIFEIDSEEEFDAVYQEFCNMEQGDETEDVDAGRIE